MKDTANIPYVNSNVNTIVQTDVLYTLHEHIKNRFLDDAEYNPSIDPWLIECAGQFSINISFMGEEEIKTIKLKNGKVSYERFVSRRSRNNSC